MNRYYFEELCDHLQAELGDLATRQVPERSQREEALEDIDDFLNVNNHKQTIPEWLRLVLSYRYVE
jgi:hypothetical protein